MKYSARVGNKTRVVPFVAAACFLTCAPMPLVSSRASAMDESRADELAPGSYVWNPSLATEGPLSMRVRLPSQTAYVYRGDTLIGVTTIASGKPGYETPDGTFTVLEKERFHNSNKYDNAPMPYMQRLSWYGLALHGGHPHGYPASHGCIRLPMGFAAALFKEETKGMEVVISGHAPGRGQSRLASRQKTRRPAEPDDLRATEFSSGQGESTGVPEPCCAPGERTPANPSALPDRAGDDDADAPSTYGAQNGDAYYNPDQAPDDERYRAQAHRRERSRYLPPADLPAASEDLPPPPD
ncbi:MAG TPA: L,D-transpeptidase family protein [Rhizomicrobium sp.]|nr:L,D-transpeptidase family protein [Rhizomicrobium sp.]